MAVVGVRADLDADTQSTDAGLAKLRDAGWDGDVDIAVGGTVLGTDESYAAAAGGAYRDRWTTMAKNLQHHRGNAQGVTYVRPFHEFNGTWYENWFVTPENVDDYKKSFHLMADIIRAECPSCLVVWSPGTSSSPGAAPLEAAYPGDDVVDVISVNSHDANGSPFVSRAEKWAEYANDGTETEPIGVEMWRRFAERHGKPLAFSEWGLTSAHDGGDDPEHAAGLPTWISEHAARPGETNLAGKVLYDVYFTVDHDDDPGLLVKGGQGPEAGRTSTSLKWGSQQIGLVGPESTPIQPQDIVLTPGPAGTVRPLLPPLAPAIGKVED